MESLLIKLIEHLKCIKENVLKTRIISIQFRCYHFLIRLLKILDSKLYMFLESNNILLINNIVFEKSNSTAYDLIQITEQIKEYIDKGKFGCGIYLFIFIKHLMLLIMKS